MSCQYKKNLPKLTFFFSLVLDAPQRFNTKIRFLRLEGLEDEWKRKYQWTDSPKRHIIVGKRNILSDVETTNEVYLENRFNPKKKCWILERKMSFFVPEFVVLQIMEIHCFGRVVQMVLVRLFWELNNKLQRMIVCIIMKRTLCWDEQFLDIGE